MSYYPNSTEARKGAFGEQIVKKILERDGWHVQKPDGTTLEFFTVKGCDKIFVHGAQLVVACG